MDAPKCRICGERHWSLCSNHLDGIAEGREVPDSGKHQSASPKSLRAKRGVPDNRTCGAQAVGIKPNPSKAKFDRVTYQREYMRKWRAGKIK